VRIVVPLKAVPDLVEEIELTPDETDIDREFLKFVLNEWDAQALEEALLVKDASGAEVVAVGLAGDLDIDQALYTAVAKGADAAIKIAGGPGGASAMLTGNRPPLLAAYLASAPADLVITGVQAPDDLDGQLPPMLAAHLGLPHVSVVVAVEADGDSVTLRQEFAGGRTHELRVRTPAIVGVQAARQAPRYAPISRIRQAMQAGGLREIAVEATARGPAPTVRRMYRPEQTSHAEMLTGSAGEVAGKIADLLRAHSLVKG
jgi:electron transfer flavoprotein beta subunit